jgi:nucleoside-diphosphate-sugar epimerase
MNSTVKKNTALVVGAQGIIGNNLINYLSKLDNWNIIGLSRRQGKDSTCLKNISVDLLDTEDCKNKLSDLSSVTHIFYAAYQDRPAWAELVQPNVLMLQHVVEIVDQAAPDLQHISLMQGYKVYGAHLGTFKTPAKETDAGHMPPEFNVDQQEYLEKKQQGKSWTWSAIRPSVVGGIALGNPMNLAVAIAVYATICKELKIPFRFPGKPGAYDKLIEVTDAGILAKATVWAATNEQCANQAFNIANGDLFRWNDMWPKIAKYFNLEVAPPLQMQLETVMADKEELWNSIIRKNSLEPHPYKDVSSWRFADFVLAWDYDVFADSTKSHKFGFHEYIDTEEMFINIFDTLRSKNIIP